MIPNRSRLAKIGYRVLGTFYGRGIVFLASILVARQLGPANMGHIGIVLSLFSIFEVCAGGQISRAMATYIAQEPERQRPVILMGTGLNLIIFLAALLAFQTLLMFLNPVSDLVARDLFLLYMPFIVCYMLVQILLAVFQGNNDIRGMTHLEIINGTLKSGLVIIAVYAGGVEGWLKGRIGGEVIGILLLLVLSYPALRRFVSGSVFSWDNALLRKYLCYYGWAFLGYGLNNVQNALYPMLTMWFISDSEQVGFISIAMTLLVSLGLFGISLTSAIYADVAALHNNRVGFLRHLRKYQIWGNASFTLLLIVLFFSAKPLILLLYNEAYLPVVPLFRIFLLAAFFQNISFINGGYWLAVGNVRLQTEFNVWSTVVFVPVTLVAVYFYSVTGLAWSVVVMKVFHALLSTRMSYRCVSC